MLVCSPAGVWGVVGFRWSQLCRVFNEVTGGGTARGRWRELTLISMTNLDVFSKQVENEYDGARAEYAQEILYSWSEKVCIMWYTTGWKVLLPNSFFHSTQQWTAKKTLNLTTMEWEEGASNLFLFLTPSSILLSSILPFALGEGHVVASYLPLLRALLWLQTSDFWGNENPKWDWRQRDDYASK